MTSGSGGSSAAASEDPRLGVKWGHVLYTLGRPHEFAWIRRQAQAVDNDPAIALYLGAGVVALTFGVAMFLFGRWVGSSSPRRPPSDRD